MKKILVPSILVVALCLSIIVGSTFALFTDRTQLDIVVATGDVEMDAEISSWKIESVKADDAGTIVDEFGGTYVYEDRTASGTFANGGTATVTGSTIDLVNITPGDKITFEISGENTSNVAVKYRYTITCLNGEDLMKGLVFTIGTEKLNPGMASYASAWESLAVGTSMQDQTISFELPVTANNDFENLSASIQIIVEVVQNNANVGTATSSSVTYY